MKILNLYAGIGGNRKLWGDEHDITAVEHDQDIANIYSDFYQNDNVIVTDAHQYLLDHYKEFDFIWSSPPCPTHSKLRLLHDDAIYPDMQLYQEVLFLKHKYNGLWVVENVTPYYEPLIKAQSIHRHLFWKNFNITYIKLDSLGTCRVDNEREFLQEELDINLDKYTGVDKRLLLRNCVVPKLGKHILDCATNKHNYKPQQQELFNHDTIGD